MAFSACSGGTPSTKSFPSTAHVPNAPGDRHTNTTTVQGNITIYAIDAVSAAGPVFSAFTNDGEMWFSQNRSNELARLTISGTQSYAINLSGPSDPLPATLLVGDDGDIWFAEYGGAAIAKFDPCTHVVTRYPTNVSGSEPWQLVKGPDGAMWFTDPGANAIGRIDYAGNVKEFPAGVGPHWDVRNPLYMTLGPDGNLWFTELNQGVVDVYSTSTHSIVKQYNSDYGFSYPSPKAIVVGSDGNMWWFNANAGTLATISPSSTVTAGAKQYQVYTANSSTDYIGNIAAGTDGNIWMSNSFTGIVDVYSTTGQKVTSYDTNTLGLPLSGFTCGPFNPGCTTNESGGRVYPYGIAGGPDGRMYVDLYNASAVIAIKP